MVRPHKCTVVCRLPKFRRFVPQEKSDAEEILLTICECEALRLNDVEKKNQYASAKSMEVSQPTFSRLLDSARTKLARAIVEGKAIRIEGGEYVVKNEERRS